MSIMDERKKAILRAVTDDYIFTAEPVGSRTIARKYSLDISPATIRNEMADLEEEGYLEQPHTSAGRVPSDKGYRFYVDTFLSSLDIESPLEKSIRDNYNKKTDEINSIVKATAKMISDMSNYTAVVIGPAMKATEIKQIHILATDNNAVMLLVFLTSGFVEHKMILVEYGLAQEELNKIANVFNDKLRGKSINSITDQAIKEIYEELNSYPSLIESAIEILKSMRAHSEEDRVYTDGIINVLEHPEFKDTNNIKTLLRFLECEELVFDAMMSFNTEGLKVSIGSENAYDEIKKCSVVGAPYTIDGRITGVVGLIGPTRLDYRRTMGLVQTVALQLSEVLNKMR